MITLKNVTKKYDNQHIAANNITRVFDSSLAKYF